MTKKRRNYPDVEEVISRPWCYYCERDFDDLKILISHQKAKHFKCERCGRRLNTAGGLNVHMNQVHKETLNSVENALPNRQSLDIEIFGMEGIPDDLQESHKQRVLQQYYEAEAARRAATGNPAPGGQDGATKKVKTESKDDLKSRLAAHKAQKLAKQSGVNSGDATPISGLDTVSTPGQGQGTPQYQAIQSPYTQDRSSPFAPGQQQFQPPQASFGQYPQQGGFPGQHGYQSSFPPQGGPGTAQAPLSFSPNGAGLPQRPGFGPPGGISGSTHQHGLPTSYNGVPDAVDDLISSVVRASEAKRANEIAAVSEPVPEPVPEKKPKKAEKNTRLVFSDNETSPEELMARFARYSFKRNEKEDVVLGEVGGAVTGVVMGQDTVIDRQE